MGYIRQGEALERLVRDHCALEASRSEADVRREYQQRLESELENAVIPPYCFPQVEGGRKHEWEWLAPDSFVLKQGFSFYHHSKDDLLEFSITRRGDAELHLSAMGNLYLDELPSPAGEESIYIVTSNGNHRRLVFACIGIPAIRARVQKAPTKRWGYYWQDRNHAAAKIICWFRQLGLIDEVLFDDDPETVFIEGRSNLAGWLLPSAKQRSVSSLLSEIQERADALDRRFGLDAELLNLLRSKTRRRWSLEWSCLRDKLVSRGSDYRKSGPRVS